VRYDNHFRSQFVVPFSCNNRRGGHLVVEVSILLSFGGFKLVTM
jgi:hypothetical protein